MHGRLRGRRCGGVAATLTSVTLACVIWACAAWACMACASVAAAAPPADARATFEAAAAEWKDVVAELTVLQAQYQQPKADKAKIAAAFDAAIAKGREIRGRLESAAVELVAADPTDKRAAQACGEALVEAIEGDDPTKALDLATKLDAAGAADSRTRLVGAAAAMLLARLDEAEAWLAKAREAKASEQEITEFRTAIDRDRPKVEAEMKKRAAEAEADDLPRVRIKTSAGDLLVELFENEAPNTVANFVSLVEKGFYDGTPFHRVIGGFMAQGGDPTGTGSGGPGYAIACECALPDARKHFLGTLSMAHAGADTGGSQFFLTFRPTEHLDGKHTVFGRVVEGLDVLPRLARTQDGTGRSIPGVKKDTILSAEVVRKRPHPYVPTTRPDPRGR